MNTRLERYQELCKQKGIGQPFGHCCQDDGYTKLFRSGYTGIYIQQDDGKKYYIIDTLDNESRGFKTMPTADDVSKFVRSHRAQYDRVSNF